MVSIIFRLLVYFKSWQNRVKVDDRVLMNSDTIFVSLEGYETTKCLMAIFCLAKMKEKMYMFNNNNNKNAIDQGILATSKALAGSNSMYLFE